MITRWYRQVCVDVCVVYAIVATVRRHTGPSVRAHVGFECKLWIGVRASLWSVRAQVCCQCARKFVFSVRAGFG